MPEQVKAAELSERSDATHFELMMGHRALLDVPPLLNSCFLLRFRPNANKYSFTLGLETVDGSTSSLGEL